MDPRRQRRRAAFGDSADRTHQRKRLRCVVHVRDRHLGQSRRTTPAPGRDPPVRDSRHAALRQALHRPLAARSRALRRVGSLAQPDRDERRARHPLDPDQRPRVGALVQSLAARPRHDRRAAALLRSLSRTIVCPCRALPRARTAAHPAPRQPQVRRARAAADPASLAVLRTAVGGRTMIAGASTHPGEETMLIEAHQRLRWSFPRLLTVVAPRHPDRGLGILESAQAAGLKAALRSRRELPRADTDVYVADTLGELGLIYRLAPIVFVGGSLASHGGQNPIEPIKVGAAVLHGPNVWNFAEVYAALDTSHGAEEVSDAEGFALQAGAWLKDARARAAVIAAARETVATLGGGLERTLAALEPYLMQIRLEYRESHA